MSTYTITPSAGANGTVSPAAVVTVQAGASYTVFAYASQGYGVATWTVDSAVAQTGGSAYTFTNVQANHTISVAFAVSPAPVSGYACELYVSTSGTPTSANALLLATDFSISASQQVIEGAPTYGSSVNGVIDPSYFANGVEKMDLNLKGYFDPSGTATKLLLGCYHATAAANKVFNILIVLGGYSITAQGLISGYTVNAKADGSLAEITITRIALFNTTINTSYNLVTVPTVGVNTD